MIPPYFFGFIDKLFNVPSLTKLEPENTQNSGQNYKTKEYIRQVPRKCCRGKLFWKDIIKPKSRKRLFTFISKSHIITSVV